LIKADAVRISSVKELWELMIRNDHYMPALKSKYCTMKTLLHVKEGKLFGMKHSAMKFKKIAQEPSKKVLLDKLIHYVGLRGGNLGVSEKKNNVPDKEWMINVIYTLSNGADEIFKKDYTPVN
jgi:hypothetical protein